MKNTALILTLILLTIGCTSNQNKISMSSNNIASNNIDDVVSSITEKNVEVRNYLLGISGYTPTNFPNSNENQVNEFFTQLRRYTQTHGVHTDWKKTEIIDLSATQLPHNTIVLVLGFQTPLEWKNSKKQITDLINQYLNKYDNIKYVAIGNEINLLKQKNPENFNDFINSYKYVYEQVKTLHPETKIFTTFNFESLIGKGYLMGENQNNIEIIDQLINHIDMIGLTTYPFMDYKNPDEVGINYFSQITVYNKTIGITETGWISRQSYGGELSVLEEQGYTGSEEEQKTYIYALKELVENNDVSFVNWIFYNDYSNWEQGDIPEQNPLFDSVGLRYNNGTQKLAYKAYREWFET